MEHPKYTPEYSSPAVERQRESDADRSRREQAETYNLATFGERRPVQAMFIRFGLFLVLALIVTSILPRRGAGGLVVLLIGVLVWTWPRWWDALRSR